MAPRTIEIVSDIVDSPANTTESLKDLRSLANATKSLASGQRNLEKRADELALSCLMAMRSALADVSLPEGQGGEVIFEAPALSSAVSPADVAAQPAPRPRAASAPRKPLSAVAGRVLTGTAAAIAILCLGATAFFAYDRLAAAHPASHSAALAPEPAVIAAPLDSSAAPEPPVAAQEPATVAPEPAVAAQEPRVALGADVEPEPSHAKSAFARDSANAVERSERVEDAPALSDRTHSEHFAAKPASETAESTHEAAAEPSPIDESEAMPNAAPAAAGAPPADSALSAPPPPKSLSDLLDEGAADLQLGGPRTADKKPTKTGLDRADLKAGMDKLRGRIHGCAARTGTNGIAKLKFSVEPDGHVSVATVVGKLASTEFASCVEPVVKGAGFPAFDGPPSTYTFPVMLTR